MADAPRNTASEAGEARRRPTAHDVARLAGVSQPVVSRAFTPGASISAEARRKVIDAAEALGYRPNLIARSLITQRSRLIGLALNDLDNQFYICLLERISSLLSLAGYGVLFFPPRPNAPSEPLLEEVLRSRVDAVILATAPVTSRFAEECARARVPVTFVNRRTLGEGVSSVTGENEEGGRQIAQFLAAGRHRRPAFLAGLADSSTSREREAGFRQGLAEAGLPEPRRGEGHYRFDLATEATRLLLGVKKPPDAIFCANDHMAFAALQTARLEFGLIPGRDISIIGFDDTPQAAWPAFDLTTFSQPFATMAERVVAITLAQLDKPGPVPVQEVVPGRLVIRGSARR